MRSRWSWEGGTGGADVTAGIAQRIMMGSGYSIRSLEQVTRIGWSGFVISTGDASSQAYYEHTASSDV